MKVSKSLKGISMGLNTLAEVADQNAANIAAAQSKKAEVSLANKAIHKFGGEDAALEFIASGGTTSALCRTLGVGAATFDRWLDKGGEARRKAYAQARARGGQSLAEQTLDIADAATPQEAQVAKLRVDTRRWLAGKLNDEYSDKQQPLVNIDLGSMALDALRHRVVTPVNGIDKSNIDEG
jgi:transposase-like protein